MLKGLKVSCKFLSHYLIHTSYGGKSEKISFDITKIFMQDSITSKLYINILENIIFFSKRGCNLKNTKALNYKYCVEQNIMISIKIYVKIYQSLFKVNICPSFFVNLSSQISVLIVDIARTLWLQLLKPQCSAKQILF